VIRRGHDDSIDGAILENTAEIFFHLRLSLLSLRNDFERRSDDIFIRIAHGDDFDIRKGGKAFQQIASPAADAENGETNLFVGFVGSAGGGNGRQRGHGCGGGVQKMTTVERGHGRSPVAG
jgi:hypothetical protein